MCAYENILEKSKNVYKIYLLQTAQMIFLEKYKSALHHDEFDKMAILELIENG